MRDSSDDRIKIAFEAPDGLIGPTVETMWAEPADGGWRVLNSPFYVYGISWGDVVTATGTEFILDFADKVRPSGHATYRIYVSHAREARWKEWRPRIEALGCSYEEAVLKNGRLYAVDVPPEVDRGPVRALLDDGEAAGIWDYEEGCVPADEKRPGASRA